MRRFYFASVTIVFILLAVLAVAHQAASPGSQPKAVKSPLPAKSKSASAGANAAHDSGYYEEDRIKYVGEDGTPKRKASQNIKATQPAQAAKGTKTESDAHGHKEQSAPPSGIILEHSRQLEKKKGKRQIDGAGSRLDRGEEEPSSSMPKQDIYERAIELIDGIHPDGGTPAIKQGLALLYEAARSGNTYAIYTLAELHEFGEHVSRNITAAARYFDVLAAMGNPNAQKALGFFYDTGKGVHRNTALALLYYEFAAQGGEVEAHITMGYKYLFGHGTRKDCGRAADHYGAVAQGIAEEVAATGLRYAYGSFSHRLANSDGAGSHTEDEDVIQYWRYSADSGDPGAQVTMGTLHLQGAYGVEQDYELARQYFARAAEQGDLGGISNLGFLHIKGYGVEQNNKTAFKYLLQAASQNHPYAQALLGYMYLHGMGVEQNIKEAVHYFMKSAEQGNSDGILHLANCYFYGQGVTQDYAKALQYYLAATEGGNLVAHFNLAQMHRFGVGANRNCHIGVSLYKKLVERGPVNELLADAHALYEEGDVDAALYRYELAAEMGIEIAQSNAAWLYDHGFGEGNDSRRQQKAFLYYSMAAEQKNPLAHLKMGDFYYYGVGTVSDHSKAAAYYRAASDLREAQATFNLGWMHQHGIGLPQDFHLAKRYYDMAHEINPDAYLAWALALASLGVHLVASHIHNGNMGFLFEAAYFGVDSELLLLMGLSVLLIVAIIARQYAVLTQQERRQNGGMPVPLAQPHLHQD